LIQSFSPTFWLDPGFIAFAQVFKPIFVYEKINFWSNHTQKARLKPYFLDQTGEFFETVHFPQSLKSWPSSGHGVYLILGKVVLEFGHPSVEVEKLAEIHDLMFRGTDVFDSYQQTDHPYSFTGIIDKVPSHNLTTEICLQKVKP